MEALAGSERIMSTNTPNFNWILPGVNDPTDADLWGGYLNTNLTNQDTLVETINQLLRGPDDTIASASTTDLGSVPSGNVIVTGTTTITSFGLTAAVGTVKRVRFSGVLTLTHNASSLIIPGSANVTTALNDCLTAVCYGSGQWIVTQYQRASGTALVSPSAASTTTAGIVRLSTNAEALAGSLSTIAATPAALASSNTSAGVTLPGGFIIKFGRVAGVVGTTGTITFPTAFPSAVYSVVANVEAPTGAPAWGRSFFTSTNTVSGFSYFWPQFDPVGTGSACFINYVAYGA